MAICLQCGIDVESKGKKPKLFCPDKCRKANKRTLANGQNKKRTEETDTVIPGYSMATSGRVFRTPEDGTVNIKTLAKLDTACGDKLNHGLPINQQVTPLTKEQQTSQRGFNR